MLKLPAKLIKGLRNFTGIIKVYISVSVIKTVLHSKTNPH